MDSTRRVHQSSEKAGAKARGNNNVGLHRRSEAELSQTQLVKPRKRMRSSENQRPTERPRRRHQSQTTLTEPSQPCEQISLSPLPYGPAAERREPSLTPIWKTIGQARIDFWRENGNWPTEEQEITMDRFQDLANEALARKRTASHLRRKRSDASVTTGTSHSQASQQNREQKSAAYQRPRYELELQERGSFMRGHEESITAQSKELIATLLRRHRKTPDHTLFSDDVLFQKSCESLKGENETKVMLRIAELIVPSAEVLALRGAKHLEIVRESTNAGWINAIPFFGPRPQPDFGLGFKREAFTQAQLQKLQPFIGSAGDCSYIAATYNMYLPFFH